MGSSVLPLQIIADVTVITSAPQVAAPSFNQGLIIDSTAAIPSYGANARIRRYLSSTFSTAMQTDGYSTSSPAYIAMTMYFSQSPAPQAGFAGRQDLTAIQTAIPHSGNAGTGYVVGDVVTVVQMGGSFGQLRVSTIGGSGVVTALTTNGPGTQGTGYATATALATTGGTGTGLEVDITAVGETPLQAVEACRLANAQWYPCMVCAAADADHIAISAWVLTQTGTIYLGTTADTTVLNGTTGNVLLTLFAATSKRTWMQYATTQSGAVPNQAYFVAAIMGQIMASNSQLAGSAFTEKFSGGVPLVAVVTEPNLTTSQIANIEGSVPSQGPNGNLFLQYFGPFNALEQGTMMAQGVFLDQILNLDVLAANIQFEIMNVLTSVPKVPQTDAGQQLLIQAVETALAQSAETGFIAPGIWRGQNVIGQIVPNQPLPTGYAAVSPKYSTLPQSQIDARIAPPIYVALIEAGAVHFVTIAVLVQI